MRSIESLFPRKLITPLIPKIKNMFTFYCLWESFRPINIPS